MFLKILYLCKTCVAVSFLKDWQLIKKRLQNRCFPANIAKFLRTTFFIENFRWLLLKVGNSVLYVYVMYCFPSLLKCFFLQQNHNFELLPCCNKIYLLWDVSILKCLSSLKKTLKKTLIIEKDTCINRSLFIYGVFIYLTWDMRTWGLLISNSMKRFIPILNATKTIKN